MQLYNATENQDKETEKPQLHFWAIGDLHYRAIPAWDAIHTERLIPMFEDLHILWKQEGTPAFCVSPGDLVETCALENYQIARERLLAQFGAIPFYPSIGNHEYHGPQGEDPSTMAAIYTAVWEKSVRYAWTENGLTCIMLDYPNPHLLEDPMFVFLSPETVAFLDFTLQEHPQQPALIFLHCPLRNTVLDRDPVLHRDYNSLQNFFSPENSQEVRNRLARHKAPSLVFSGHTHSGWESPNLVCIERHGGQPVTFVNLMSPWYTGRHTGPRLSEDSSTVTYVPDDPDVIPTFSIHVYQNRASIRVRDHHSRQWLKEWIVPM